MNLERSPRGSVVCLQFDARTIVSGSNDTTLRVWNRDTGHCQQIISGHDRTVRCLEFRNNICFSGGSDRFIKVSKSSDAVSKCSCNYRYRYFY